MGALTNLVIAVTGTLPADTSQLKKWIEANGGRYSPHVHKGITHLITGKDAWKNATDPVQAATKAGAFIVSYDWLEDSLQKRRKLAERKYTWEYLWQERKKRKQMKRLGTLADTKKFEDGCEEARKATGTGTSKSRAATRKPKPSKSFFFADMVNVPFVSAADELKRRRDEREAAKSKKAEEAAVKKNEDGKSDQTISRTPFAALSLTSKAENLVSPCSATSHALSTTSFQTATGPAEPQAKNPSLKDLYHYYLDTTGFEYKIILTRCDLRANQITKYRLSLLESHTKPHVYCTFVEYFPPGAGTAGSGEAACFQALMDYSTTFDAGVAEDSDTAHISTCDSEVFHAAPSHTDHLLPQQGLHNHPEAARLRSLLSPSISSPSTSSVPYKSLIAPLGSTFDIAWRTFRHAFRDLTLLSWEERFDITKVLYKFRARHFGIEPFVYVRPKNGLPLGLRVQEAGLFQNQTLPPMDNQDRIVSTPPPNPSLVTENDDGYVYNAFSLPALSQPLGPGIVGAAVQHDDAAALRHAERAALLADEVEAAQRFKNTGLASKSQRKPNSAQPLFNSTTGRSTTDAWGRCKNGAGGRRAGGSELVGGGMVEKRRPFPAERRAAWE